MEKAVLEAQEVHLDPRVQRVQMALVPLVALGPLESLVLVLVAAEVEVEAVMPGDLEEDSTGTRVRSFALVEYKLLTLTSSKFHKYTQFKNQET